MISIEDIVCGRRWEGLRKVGRINKTKGIQVEVLAHFYLGTTLHCFGRCIYIERTIYSIIKTALLFWIMSSKDRKTIPL